MNEAIERHTLSYLLVIYMISDYEFTTLSPMYVERDSTAQPSSSKHELSERAKPHSALCT